MKTKLICDIRLLLCFKRRLVVSVLLSVAFGLLTLFACDGIGIVWKLTEHPPFTPPLVIIIVLDLILCALYGVLWSCVTFCCKNSGECCLKIAVSYVLFIFWCPLALLARVYIVSATAIMISAIYLLVTMKFRCKVQLFRAIIVSIILTVYALFLYFSLSLALGI